MSDLSGNEHLGRAARAQYLCCLVLSLSIVYFCVKYFRLYHRRDDNESCSTDTQKKRNFRLGELPAVRQFFIIIIIFFFVFFSIDS
jgi:Na+/melibiose symporter-like transporter